MTLAYSPFRARSGLSGLEHWNVPRPSKADLERTLCSAPNREEWLEAKRQYLEETSDA